jgi:microcystin-dependent protein
VSNPFLAEIRIFPFNFAPKGWAFCNGQIMSISQNTALFSLLGTTYGGDGKSNFALPNLQGNAPMHPGQGPGLSLHDLGETGGSDTVTLLQSQMPSHLHAVTASQADATDRLPTGNLPAGGLGIGQYAAPGTVTNLSTKATTAAGGGLAHNNLMPYLTLNFCIALQGVFPARN